VKHETTIRVYLCFRFSADSEVSDKILYILHIQLNIYSFLSSCDIEDYITGKCICENRKYIWEKWHQILHFTITQGYENYLYER